MLSLSLFLLAVGVNNLIGCLFPECRCDVHPIFRSSYTMDPRTYQDSLLFYTYEGSLSSTLSAFVLFLFPISPLLHLLFLSLFVFMSMFSQFNLNIQVTASRFAEWSSPFPSCRSLVRCGLLPLHFHSYLSLPKL